MRLLKWFGDPSNPADYHKLPCNECGEPTSAGFQRYSGLYCGRCWQIFDRRQRDAQASDAVDRAWEKFKP